MKRVTIKQQNWMDISLQLARQAVEHGEVPVGAVIVKDGALIASAHNLTLTHNDPTAHAEILVIRAAAKELGRHRLTDCDLYVTLEPCAMCAAAISLARLRRVYFGASDIKGGAVENGVRFFNDPTCSHRPEIYGGIAAVDASELLQEFFKKRR